MDISYASLAGSYGLSAHSGQTESNTATRALDILVLKRNGNYAVHLAKQRTAAALGALTADLSGHYTITEEGALCFNSTDLRFSATGQCSAHGIIALRSSLRESVKQRWLAQKIICIWPKCHDCRGNRWQYCVRERVLNSL